MSDQEPIVRLEDVEKAFGDKAVLRGINLSISRGSTTVIIGPSGCGKSVLLKHIVGLMRPDKGKVYFDGQELGGLTEEELVPLRRRIGFVFQGGALFDSMNVEENVGFPLAEHDILDREQRGHRCRDVLRLVGLDGTQEMMPEELSGGQKKRVALARAIALHPEVILYDEPTTGLDPIRADLINELILRLQRQLHATSIVVTHDMASARKVGNRILMLHEGHFIADAPPSELAHLENDAVRQFVEGRASEDELRRLEHGQLADI